MYRSNVIEEENEALPEENEEFLIVIKPYEIATFGIRPNINWSVFLEVEDTVKSRVKSSVLL